MAYDPDFIPGCHIELPELSPSVRATAFGGGLPIEHSRFSIFFNQARGLAIVTAHNIDGATFLDPGPRRRDNFRFDPNVPNELQIDNDRGYRNNPWDRGHLVRRQSLHWQDFDEAEIADQESFHWTNIAPQHNRLHHMAWGDIEGFMVGLADDGDKRAAVFTGPVFTEHDPAIVNREGEEPIQIPAGFWKILAIKKHQMLQAAAFLVWQRDFDREDPVEFEPVLEQVRITTIEFLTGLMFTDLRNADPLHFGATATPQQDDEPAVVAQMPSATHVRGPEDICLMGA